MIGRAPKRALAELSHEERGLATIEYIIIVCLVAIVGFLGWRSFGETVEDKVAGSSTVIGSLPTESGTAGAAGTAGSSAAASSAASTSTDGAAAGTSSGTLLSSTGDFVYGVGAGAVSAAWGTVTGTIDVVLGVGSAVIDAARDPGAAWAAVRGAASDPVGTAGAVASTAAALGRAALDWGRKAVHTFQHGTWEERGRLLGAGAFEVASAGLLPATKVGAMGRVAHRVDEASDVARAAKRVDEAADAARVAGRTESSEGALAGVARRERERERLGEGSFSVVYRDGDDVIKEIKPTVGRGDQTWDLDSAQRGRLAELQVEFTRDLREADSLGDMIPPVELAGSGRIRQPYTEGLTLDELRSRDVILMERAHDNAIGAVRRAERHYGLGSGETGTVEGGWRIQVDDNMQNFRFNGNGDVSAWIDPVAVWPPSP